MVFASDHVFSYTISSSCLSLHTTLGSLMIFEMITTYYIYYLYSIFYLEYMIRNSKNQTKKILGYYGYYSYSHAISGTHRIACGK